MGIGVCDRCWKRECECQPPQSPDPRDERIAELERERDEAVKFSALDNASLYSAECDLDRMRAERDRLKEALEGDTLTAKRVNQLLEQRDELQADNARLKTELENAKTLWARSIEQVCEEQTEALRLREALEWYADIANYGEYEIQGKRGPLRTSNVGYDTGERARQALSGEKEKKDG